MSELRALQEAFWRGLCDEAPPWLARELVGGTERLAIYADMYHFRLEEILAQDFPALACVLGSRFPALAEAYLAAHPSRQPSVRHFGAALPAWLHEPWLHEPWLHEPWLQNLAALEWARRDVFDRADDVLQNDPRAFADPAAQVRAIRAHALLQLDYAIEPVWRARGGAQPARTPHALVVWRKRDGTVHHRSLADDEAKLVPKLAAGASLVALCDELTHIPPGEAAYRVFSLVSSWCLDELLGEAIAAG